MPLLSTKAKKPATIRVEKVEVRSPRPTIKHRPSVAGASSAASSKASASPRASPKPKLPRRQSASPYPSSADEKKRNERKRKLGSADLLQPRFEKDSDDDDDDDGGDYWESLDMAKRQRRVDSENADESRTLTWAGAFDAGASADKDADLGYIHATDIMNSAAQVRGSVKRALKATEADDIRVRIQYPSLYMPESYELLVENGNIDAVKDIIKVVSQVGYFYLSDEDAAPFTDANSGLIRRLQRASNKEELGSFREALRNANDKIRSLVKDGTIRKALDRKHGLPRDLVEFILTQVYDRTVSPDVEKLRQYTNGTDNVYGELNYVFISKILQEKTRMTSKQCFVDLGSGVGNVVFQAALEVGCESWGCEMMDNPCDFAEAQQAEFDKRCRLWGIKPGDVHLVRGDFLTQTAIHDVLKRADVVLVNNQAFTPDLNAKLVNVFLDLKEGCKIVSLKSFTHDQGVRSINDVASNILEVEQHTFPEGHVSWTNNGGTFYISTKK